MANKKSLILSIRNILQGTGALILNPIVQAVVSIILWITFSFTVGVIYFSIIWFLRPLCEKLIVPTPVRIENNDKNISGYLISYSTNPNYKIEKCISKVSYLTAEQLNYTGELFLSKKQLNYVAMIISAYMILIAYYTLNFNNLLHKKKAASYSEALNSKVHYHTWQGISNSHSQKTNIKNNSSEVLKKLLKEKDEKSNLQKLTHSLIKNYLGDKGDYLNNDVDFYMRLDRLFMDFAESINTRGTNIQRHKNFIYRR